MPNRNEISFFFHEEFDGLDPNMINSITPTVYTHVSRPASILFSLDVSNFSLKSRINAQIEQLPGLYRWGRNYEVTSGKRAIPAEHSVAFLNMIKDLLVKYPDDLFVSRKTLSRLLSRLTEHGHLSIEKAEQYSKQIATIYTVENMESDANANEDANLAIELASRFDSGYEPAYWIWKARTFDRNHPVFSSNEQVSKILGTKERVYLSYLFHSYNPSFGRDESAEWLLGEIANTRSITHLYLFNSVDRFDPRQ